MPDPQVPRVKYRRTPFLVVTQESAVRKDVYGSVGDHVARQAQLLRGEADSDTVIICMHPIGSPAYLPLFPELARTGLHSIGSTSRYTVGDAALQMENVLLDIGACVRDARERLGYRKVVLAGWSGGGSPMMGYQAEAEKPAITRTGAGEPTLLSDTELPAADAVMLLAAPRSRHRLLTDFLDASITDEADPDRHRAREFDSTTRPTRTGRRTRPTSSAPTASASANAARGSPRARRTSSPRSRRPGAPTTSTPSSCTARWPTRAGWTRRWNRTVAGPARVTSAIPRWPTPAPAR